MSQPRLRLLEEWNSYRKAMPAGAPQVQIREMRLAFYAGAMSMYSTIMNQLTAGSDATEPADMQMLADLDTELRQFGQDVKAGRV